MGKKAAKPAFPAPSQAMVQQGFQLLDPTNSGFVNPYALSDVSCPCTVTPLLHISALDPIYISPLPQLVHHGPPTHSMLLSKCD